MEIGRRGPMSETEPLPKRKSQLGREVAMQANSYTEEINKREIAGVRAVRWQLQASQPDCGRKASIGEMDLGSRQWF